MGCHLQGNLHVIGGGFSKVGVAEAVLDGLLCDSVPDLANM